MNKRMTRKEFRELCKNIRREEGSGYSLNFGGRAASSARIGDRGELIGKLFNHGEWLIVGDFGHYEIVENHDERRLWA